MEEAELREFRFQPTSSSEVTLALRPDRYRFVFVAWQQRTARPVRDGDRSITQRRFARGAVLPGLCGKCTHTRS